MAIYQNSTDFSDRTNCWNFLMEKNLVIKDTIKDNEINLVFENK